MSEPTGNFSRAEFLNVTGASIFGFFVAVGLSACGVKPENERKFQGTNPSLAFFFAMTGIQLEAGTPTIAEFINDPLQRDNLLAAIVGNQRSVENGIIIAANQALEEGRMIGGSFCSDSRLNIAIEFPAISLSPNSIDNFSLVENRIAGAQPSLFNSKITRSIFASHEATPGCGSGCGFLGGVEKLFTEGKLNGIQALKDHGIPKETISEIINWYDIYGKEIDFTKLTTAEQWSEIGGHIQAYINSSYDTRTHYVLYGVQAHGTNTFNAIGVVDNFGKTFTLEEAKVFAPELVGAAKFLNQPHPAIESLVAGQKPNANVLSVSRHGPQALFGDNFIRPGETFVINQTAFSNGITTESLDGILASQGYSLGVLEQRAKMIYLVADNLDDMAKIRQALLGSSFFDDFLKKGGLIVELMPDENGLFRHSIVLRNFENPLMYLTLSAEEQTLLRNGAQKIVGDLRIGKVDGKTILVRVQSAVNGQVYELNIPKATITAELLEKAGLPAIEALWYEKFFAKFGSFLGKAGIVAGLLGMGYEGIKWGAEIMGLGATVQLGGNGKTPDNNGEIVQTILKLGLDNTAANRIYEDKPMPEIVQRLINRITTYKNNIPLASLPSYYLKLDNPDIRDILFIAGDSQYDYQTPIQVTPEYHQGESSLIIDKITYENTADGQKIVFSRQEDGSYKITSGPDFLTFQTIVKIPNNNNVFSVPLKLNFGDQGQAIISPNWQETND